MINIYDKTETVFNHSGLATLEPIECVFAPMINDVWKLEMTLPYDSEEKYKLIENDKLIRVTGLEAVSEQAGTQVFRIYDFKKRDNSVYVLAYPVGLDARFETLTDYLDLRDKTASQAISLINNMAAKYTVTTDLTSVNSAEYKNKNMIEILNGEDGFVHKWGGEICYDNYNIKVNRKLGNQNRSIDVRYGKNIQSMTYELDASNVVTRLYPKSQNGDILNGIPAYAYGQTRYIDSPKINDYPIIHNYYVKAPYVLLNMTDDGSLTYLDTIMIYNQIKTAVYNLVEARTNAIMTSNSNIDLGWLKWLYSLKIDDNGISGFAERVANLALQGTVSLEYQELAKKAVAEGFKGYFDIVDEGYEWLETEQGFIYYPNGNEDWRWKETWAKDGNTWKYINVHGYHDSISPESSKTWSWFKKKGDNFKSYGIKENATYKRLFHEQYKINDVWYYFDAKGMPYKGSRLFDMLHMDSLYDEIATSAYGGTTLQAICYNGEAHMYNLLYMQMTDYCSGMFSTQGIDKPTVDMEIDVVDLSKTTEYKDYENLLKIHLGDKVKCINTKLDLASEERVIGLEYDVVRGFNRKVYIGLTENSVINMLNVSTNNEVKLIAGEGINIQNNVISVVPTPINAVKDVRIDGESVVTANVADIDSSQFGLQYFIETENALFGTDDFLEFIKDGRYAFKPQDDKSVSMLGVTDSSWSYTEERQIIKPIFKTGANREKDYVFAFTPETSDDTYPLYIHSLQHDWSHGGMIFLTNNISAIDRFSITRSWYNYNKDTGESSSNSYSGTVTVPSAVETVYESQLTDSDGYKASTRYAKAIVTIDGAQWVAMWFWKHSRDYQTSSAASIETYLPASDLPLNGYDTLGDLARAVIPLWKAGDGTASGIARQNGLAFFAGADDDLGTNAPIKIFNDGTYQGLDKVEDVLVNGISVLHEKMADIDLSDYQKKSVHILQEDYNNLSDEQKKNGRIYFVYKYNYEFHESSDGTLVIRIGADGTKWFFRGYTKESGDVTPPSSLSSYVPSSLIMTSNYPEGGTSQNGWIGFYQNKIRSWNQSKAQTMAGTFYGVLDVNGVESQITPYYDPYDDVTPIMISYMGVEYYVGGIADVEADGVSIVHQGVASITSGDNIQIQDGVISATNTTYSDFAGSTHGLVPPASSGDSGKFLKGDGTWAEAGGGGGGTSDLDAVELTKAQYDALTPAEKADEDKIYFVKDYIPPQPGGGSTISITPTLSSGTKIADYEIDGVTGEIYAPNDGYTAGYGIDIDNGVISEKHFKSGDAVMSYTNARVLGEIADNATRIYVSVPLRTKVNGTSSLLSIKNLILYVTNLSSGSTTTLLIVNNYVTDSNYNVFWNIENDDLAYFTIVKESSTGISTDGVYMMQVSLEAY